MKKSLLKIALVALAALASISQSAKAAVQFNYGDLILGFRATGGTGSTSNLMINLGAGTFYRDRNDLSFSIGNFNTDLTNTYGSNWASRTDLVFGIVGVRQGGLPPSGPGTIVNGDGQSTIYASNGSAGFSLSNAANEASISANILGLNGVFDVATEGATLVSAVLPTSTTNGWSSWAPTSFGGVGDSFESGFVSGQGVADIYRYVPRLSGSLTENPATALVGVSQGTFTIAGNGDITYGVVPEPSTYALFLAGGIALFVVYRRKKMNAAA